MGVNPQWREFFLSQRGTYDYQKHRYSYGDGLDCSGYVGWVLYNLWKTKSRSEGYVYSAKKVAVQCALLGWGSYEKIPKSYRPGDIMSGDGHVYIVIGACQDGSIVLIHSTPQGGVQLSGTMLEDKRSQAMDISEYYMKNYYLQWYDCYGCLGKSQEYLNYAQMRWYLGDHGVLTDEEKYAGMSAREVLKNLYEESETI